MLRDGCHVITTTRFPHDASKRFAEQNDFDEWKSRVHLVFVHQAQTLNPSLMDGDLDFEGAKQDSVLALLRVIDTMPLIS